MSYAQRKILYRFTLDDHVLIVLYVNLCCQRQLICIELLLLHVWIRIGSSVSVCNLLFSLMLVWCKLRIVLFANAFG